MLGRQPIRKRDTVKNRYRIIYQLSAVDKDDKDSEQTFNLGYYRKKHNYLSVNPIGLLYYRRQQRSDRFRKFLQTYYRAGVLPLQIRALAKEEFIVKPRLSATATIPILRDIYNKFAKIRAKLIISKTPVNQILATLKDKQFFYVYKYNNSRLVYIFFAYLELIKIYRDNAKVLIYNYIYNIVQTDLLLLCFDFVTRLGTMLLLVYIIMYDETFKSYIQAFKQLKRLFKEYNIDDYNILIYNRDRAAINAIIAVFLGLDTILCTQYIDIAIRAYVVKTFRQQKNKETNRFELSELTNEFLALYRNCRYVPSEEVFD